ncbi:hypothetical protein [Microlunatus sp. GCM10028923]|uniref:hypothetical protein n=1 Tax=Microlunatus sp. GCM10028923 TaxID=3273400 RepID=UPI00361FF8D2
MFESLESKAVGYGSRDILKAVDGLKRARIAVANELLVWVAAWADAHPAESIMETGPGLARAVRPGGEGTPAVNDLAMVELSAKLGKSTSSGMLFLGDVLDLRHRLPQLWAKVMGCEVEEWQALRVARMTHRLSQEQAGEVDRAVAWFAGTQPPRKLFDTVEATILRIDGDRARAEYEERRKQVGVWKSQTDDNGLKGVFGRLEPLAAERLYARVQELADCLSEGTADERRAEAFGLLGDAAAITRLRAKRRQPELFDEELAEAVAALTPGDEPELMVEESEVHPALRDRPASVDVESAIFEAAVQRLVEKLDPKLLVPTSTVVVHISAEDLAQDEGVCRVPEIGPALKSVIGDWLHHDRVIVRPVIDLNDAPPPVDDYEIPNRHRDHALLRCPGSVFPWSTATRNLDLDHTDPYRPNGPPGQTRVEKLIPLSRTEHRAVTHGGWRRRKPDPTTMIFRSPHGHVFLTNRTGTHDLGAGPVAHALWSAA